MPSFYYLQLERTLPPLFPPIVSFSALTGFCVLPWDCFISSIYFENGPNNTSPRWAAPTRQAFWCIELLTLPLPETQLETSPMPGEASETEKAALSFVIISEKRQGLWQCPEWIVGSCGLLKEKKELDQRKSMGSAKIKRGLHVSSEY